LFADAADSTYCGMIRASRLDELVEAEVLRALAELSVEAIQLAAREALREHEALVRAQEDEVRRARQAVAEAERAYAPAPATQPHFKERMALNTRRCHDRRTTGWSYFRRDRFHRSRRC